MKKTLSLILALLMAASCASGVFADEDAAIADEPVATSEAVEEAVDESPAEAATPYDRAIKFLTTYNIMHGKEDGLLHAEQAVKRFEMALFTGRILSGWVDDDKWEDFDANDSGFVDLEGTGAENVYGAMSYVSQKGVIEGYGNGIFKPEKTVTYREALTMAVRCLGYNGLEWPWGYIEKAVNLGITDGIEGVAYTDECNRGVAAQIIYNTLFADNSKLGLQSFGTAFGWSDVVITATADAKYTTADYKTPKDYVAFQVIEDDGTLSKTIYYAAASQFGLDLEKDKHADELVLGEPYSVLFEMDGDDNLVTIVDYDKIEANVIKNQGLTDNDGKPYEDTDPIGTYLKPLTIVDKYTGRILANEKHDDSEIIIATAGKVTEYLKFDYNKSPYAYDWETGNILLADKNDKGEYKVVEVKDDGPYTFKSGDKKYNYESYHVEWYRNDIEGYYFKVQLTNNGDFLGIIKMEEEELAEIRKVIDDACKLGTDKLVYVPFDGKTSLHAELDSFKTEAGLRGNYEGYGYGYMEQKTEWCGDHNANHDFIKINGARVAELSDGAWYQEAYAPALDKDGKIVSNYVIYYYNQATKEFKVIKTIEAYSDKLVDADTYYTTGVLGAFSLKNKKVVIGDVTYPLSQNYGTFKFDKDDDNYKDGKYKAYLTDKFEGLFLQFVTYYVLDGEVVEIEPANAHHNGYIVADSYAGISNDGYIVVNGYSTEELKYDRFRIGSYNHWNEGDFFWYGNQISDEFIKGQVYNVLSYDKDNDVYYVETLGEVDDENNPTKFVYNGDWVEITFDSGYRLFRKDGQKPEDVEPKKATSSDKYILIPAISPTAKYMPIVVYEGKANNNWSVSGIALGCNKDSKTFVIADAVIDGFISNEYWKNSGLALVVKKQIMEKFYDGAGLDPEEWYLNGATETAETLVFNFYTGEFEYAASALNKSLKVGKVYRMIDGVLTEQIEDQTWAYLWTEFLDTYTNLSNADHGTNGTGNDAGRWYRFVQDVVVKEAYCDNDKDKFSKEVVSGAIGLGVEVKGLVNSLKVVKLVKDDDGQVYSVEAINKDAFKKLVKDMDVAEVMGDLILKSTGDGKYDCVLYIDPDDCLYINKGEKVDVESINVLPWDNDFGTGVTAEATKREVVDGNVKYNTYTIDKIGFELFGSATKNDHETLFNNKFYFDILDRCSTLGNWEATLTFAGHTGKIYETDIDFETYKYHKDVTGAPVEDTCNLVKAFEFETKDVSRTTDGEYPNIVVNSIDNVGVENAVTVVFSARMRDELLVQHVIFFYVDEDGELVTGFYDTIVDGESVEQAQVVWVYDENGVPTPLYIDPVIRANVH